ncbi:MAG: hypothetical protein QF437_32820, partial [Planctomycetota bacterium]|nr:hypothetical protein [Planctomycetota bacterium]
MPSNRSVSPSKAKSIFRPTAALNRDPEPVAEVFLKHLDRLIPPPHSASCQAKDYDYWLGGRTLLP